MQRMFGEVGCEGFGEQVLQKTQLTLHGKGSGNATFDGAKHGGLGKRMVLAASKALHSQLALSERT